MGVATMLMLRLLVRFTISAMRMGSRTRSSVGTEQFSMSILGPVTSRAVYNVALVKDLLLLLLLTNHQGLMLHLPLLLFTMHQLFTMRLSCSKPMSFTLPLFLTQPP